MKNAYGEIVKPRYEVVLLTWASTTSIEEAKKNHDLESFSFISCANYRDAVAKAKKASMDIGRTIRGDYGINEVVEVRITCYFEDDTSTYNEVWFEYYENGKKDERIEIGR